MKTLFLPVLISLSIFAHHAFALIDEEAPKEIATSELIQQAMELRSLIRLQLGKMGTRITAAQAEKLSGNTISRTFFDYKEPLAVTEWYYLETMKPVDIEAAESRLNELVHEYKSTKTGSFSLPSEGVTDCTKKVIELIKYKRARSVTTQKIAELESNIDNFVQVIRTLGERSVSDEEDHVMKDLIKWVRSTGYIERSYAIQKITMHDFFHVTKANGYLEIDGEPYYGKLGCDLNKFTQRSSVINQHVLY